MSGSDICFIVTDPNISHLQQIAVNFQKKCTKKFVYKLKMASKRTRKQLKPVDGNSKHNKFYKK